MDRVDDGETGTVPVLQGLLRPGHGGREQDHVRSLLGGGRQVGRTRLHGGNVRQRIVNVPAAAVKPQPANIINHIVIVLDASSSMIQHSADVVKVADTQIANLADTSKFHDQETRVTICTFSSPEYHDGQIIKVPIYDKDVLRMPSMAGFYRAYGNTSLCDAMLKVIDDIEEIPMKYGDHSV